MRSPSGLFSSMWSITDVRNGVWFLKWWWHDVTGISDICNIKFMVFTNLSDFYVKVRIFAEKESEKLRDSVVSWRDDHLEYPKMPHLLITSMHNAAAKLQSLAVLIYQARECVRGQSNRLDSARQKCDKSWIDYGNYCFS